MEALLIKYLKKVQNEPSPKPAGLAKEVENLLSVLSEIVEVNARSGQSPRHKNADIHFAILHDICESKQPRMVELALSCIHVLIERGYLQGKSPIDSNGMLLEARGEEKQGSNDRCINEEEEKLKGGDGTPVRFLIDYIIETVCKCSEINDDNVHLQAIKALLTAITSSHCEVHEATLLLAIQACFHIHLVSKSQINKITAKAALTQMVSNTVARMEVLHQVIIMENGKKGSTDSMKSTSSTEGTSFLTPTHKDSFLIFRALCKLSMKGAQADFDSQAHKALGGDIDSNTLAIQNKMLSLELILIMLKKSGEAFRTGEKFVDAMRKYLCMSLLGNCTSQVTMVTGLSLQIFVALMDGFKEHLKTEFEVFFTSVFIKILESENSTHDQKQRVLEVFHCICKDSTNVLEFFVNYDCDLDSTDIFKRIVDGYARIVKAPGTDVAVAGSGPAVASKLKEEESLRSKGLEGLVMILQSLLRLKGLEDVSAVADAHTPSTSASQHGLGGGSKEEAGEPLMSDTGESGSGSDPGSPTSAKASPTNSSSGYGGGSHGNISNKVVDAFDRKQKMQEQIEVGILKFNQGPKKGLLYLADVGHITMEAKSVAKLFHLEERLDKSQIGDFLAREPEYMDGFPMKVLHEYVEMLDFANMSFDLALRHFLTGFRLPGEAQKIDRLMEKFAERYYLQNSDSFASADMAFILAFSTIMLQTNLHNPAIKDDKRMTKDQFIKQNKGITSDGELPDELLAEIYDRIAAEEISMTAGEAAMNKREKNQDSTSVGFGAFQGTAESRRIDAFNDERKEMMRASQTLFKKKHANRGSFFVKVNEVLTDSTADEYARPMFDVAWAPIIGVLSHVFETYEDEDDDKHLLELCMTGFRHGVRLACRLGFPVGRSTYINALSKFSALDMVREMRGKNLEAAKTLMEVAFTEGDYLENSWKEVFTCITRLSRLEQFSEGLHLDEDFFGSDSKPDDGEEGAQQRSNLSKLKALEESNATLVSSEAGISTWELDRLFLNSNKLSQESMEHFVRELCSVSREEISSDSTVTVVAGKEILNFEASPRIFSLQKLVEVADFNMHSRSRLAWATIWSMLADHFTLVGTDENLSVAMYAIDSLKQLSIKFLQKEELSNFNFQRLFLKPFEVIMSKSKFEEIDELVLRCIDMMILACAPNIRSGWRTIFLIFEGTARHNLPEVSESAFGIIERLMESWFDFLFQSDAVALMNCLVSFVGGRHAGLSLRALTHLRMCADKLAIQGTPTIPTSSTGDGSSSSSSSSSTSTSGQIDGDQSVFGLWWPLLFGLATHVADSRLDVRLKALNTLEVVLEVHGHLFSEQAWQVIFRGVLFPMIDSAKMDVNIPTMSKYPTENPVFESRGDSWIGTIGLAVLNILLQLFKRLKEQGYRVGILLPDFLAMLESCICHPTEALARMGLSTLGDLVISMGTLSEEDANLIVSFVSRIMSNNLCINFGQAGTLECSQDIPTRVKITLLECMCSPLNQRISESQGHNRAISVGDSVITLYGEGEVMEVLEDALGSLELRPRHCIQLPWGTMYSSTGDSGTRPEARRASFLAPEQLWAETAKSAMTSMVVSLDVIHVVAVIFAFFDANIRPEAVSTVLNALEASHWHARSFNEDSRLSMELQGRKFMHFPGQNNNEDGGKGFNSPPNLLEQEIKTSSQILEITQLLATMQEYQKDALPWVKRYTASVIERYLELDASLQGENPIDKALIDAYKPAVMTVLEGLKDCTAERYYKFGYGVWMMPLITKLILCHDFEVRVRVSSLLPALVKFGEER